MKLLEEADMCPDITGVRRKRLADMEHQIADLEWRRALGEDLGRRRVAAAGIDGNQHGWNSRMECSGSTQEIAIWLV